MMLKINFDTSKKSLIKFLFLGAHSDDVEIGCGATVLKLLGEIENPQAHWVVFSAGRERAAEAEKSALKFIKSASQKKISILNFKDGFFPYIGGEIKDYFENLKKEISPDIIFTHYRQDLHQDHRIISELTWNTFRNHLILEYEIIKYDGDLGSPNFFVHLNKRICEKKVNYILGHFKTQGSRTWFNEETFMAIMKLRGLESNAPEHYAEGFYCRKLAL